MVNVALLSNLKSGKNLKDKKDRGLPRRVRKFDSIIGDRGKIYFTGRNGDYRDELERNIEQICKDRPDVVIAEGGDATAMTVFTFLEKLRPEDYNPLGASLPGGTFCILPKKRLKVENPNKYLSDIVKTSKNDAAHRFTIDEIPVMKVKDDSGNEHLSFSVGMGFPVTMLEEIYKKKKLKYFRLIMMGIKALGSAIIDGKYYRKFDKSQRLKVTLIDNNGNKEVYERDWLGIMAQSITTIGLPKSIDKVFLKAEKSSDMFHAVGTDLNFRGVLKYCIPIATGDSPGYQDRSTGEWIRVLPLNHQVRSMNVEGDKFHYQFNGELTYGPDLCVTNNLQISNGPSLRIISNFFR